MLVNRLNDHILGKTELEQTQIKAIEILMARVAPTLSAVEQTNISADDKLDENQILIRIAELIDNHPDLLQRALAAKAKRSAALPTQAISDDNSASMPVERKTGTA